MVKIKGLNITNIGPILDLTLNFDSNFNIICGQNGIGKTTILDCLAQSFSINTTNVRRTAGKESGSWSIDAVIDEVAIKKTFNITSFHPNESAYSQYAQGLYQNSEDVIVFRTHRDIPYSQLRTLSTDPDKNYNQFSTETLGGSLPNDLKNWFVNRFLFSAQPGTLDESQLKNFEIAKKCFTILNPEISFSTVIPASFDILLHSPAGEIYFEYLSSGYKSCLAVLLGLIKEIEIRHKNPYKFIKDFDGIVFVDEIDLHLHPEWQVNIYMAIKELLPNAQVFVSTHSPHIIQVAEPKEIIAIAFDKANVICLNPLLNEEFGCQGWTVEEILRDVMGLSETRTPIYRENMELFNKAIELNDSYAARGAFDVIDRMLHPENSLKKILRIQLAGIAEND